MLDIIRDWNLCLPIHEAFLILLVFLLQNEHIFLLVHFAEGGCDTVNSDKSRNYYWIIYWCIYVFRCFFSLLCFNSLFRIFRFWSKIFFHQCCEWLVTFRVITTICKFTWKKNRIIFKVMLFGNFNINSHFLNVTLENNIIFPQLLL